MTWGLVQTDQKACLVYSFGHGVEGAFPLAPESEWEKQGRRVDVSRGLCPPKHCDSAAEDGAAKGLWSNSHTYSPKGKWGHQCVREPGSKTSQVPGPCECIPHKARAPWDWRACPLLTVRREKRSCLFNHTRWYCVENDKTADRCPFADLSIISKCSGFERCLRRENYATIKAMPSRKHAKAHGSSQLNSVSKKLWSLAASNSITSRDGISLGVGQSLRGEQGQIPALKGRSGDDAAAIEHWTWVQAVLASHLLEAALPPLIGSPAAHLAFPSRFR